MYTNTIVNIILNMLKIDCENILFINSFLCIINIKETTHYYILQSIQVNTVKFKIKQCIVLRTMKLIVI